MSRREDYAKLLAGAKDQVAFLRKESRLPGPRANLELLDAAADVGDEPSFRRWITAGSGTGPTDEFVAACGVVGLGRLVADGATRPLADLRTHATDARWRVREAVAIGLQRVGDRSADRLLQIVRPWATARPYVQRAAVAAVCEPRLLKDRASSKGALGVLDRVTASVAKASDRRSDEFRALRQALGYCWSVAVAANPGDGKPAFQRWARSNDPDIRWIIAENLKKARLAKIFPAQVAHPPRRKR